MHHSHVYPRVVISLTTIPSRLKHIGKTIASLLTQQYPIDGIYLHLPKYSIKEKCQYGQVPQEYLHPLLHINRQTKDYGPITKLIPTLALEQDPETIIIVVDDDTVYPKTMVHTFVKNIVKYRKAAVGCSGHIIGSNLFEYLGTVYSTDKTIKPTRVDYLQGVYGMAFKRKFFDLKKLLDYSNVPKKSAFFMDDIWIGAHLCQRDIARLVIKGPLPQVQPDVRNINGISNNLFFFGGHQKKLIQYFRRKGYFQEGQVADPNLVIGHYIWLVSFSLVFLGVLLAMGLMSVNRPKKTY